MRPTSARLPGKDLLSSKLEVTNFRILFRTDNKVGKRKWFIVHVSKVATAILIQLLSFIKDSELLIQISKFVLVFN